MLEIIFEKLETQEFSFTFQGNMTENFHHSKRKGMKHSDLSYINDSSLIKSLLSEKMVRSEAFECIQQFLTDFNVNDPENAMVNG